MMENNRVKQALNNTLSSLYVNDAEASALLAQAKGGKKVKKKLSVALVLTMILMLLTIGAVAAVILSNKQFVDQIVAPMAKDNASNTWTGDEVVEIIRLAEKNGIMISDEIQNRINNHEGRSKIELMRSFVSAELGPYIATWSIEDQAWFDELLVRSGLSEQQTRFTPSNGEISEAVALDKAKKHIESAYKCMIDNSTSTAYIVHTEYRQFVKGNGDIEPRRWYFHFEPNDSSLDSFDVVVSSQGEIIEAKRVVGVKNIGDVASVEAIFDYYDSEYGMHYEWSQKVWESFQADLQRSVDKHGLQTNFTAFALKQKYGVSQTSTINQHEAVNAAFRATAETSGINEEELRKQYKSNALLLVGKEGLIWKVSLVNTNPGKHRSFDLRHAEVNATSGEVKNVMHYEPGKNSIYDAYYLIEVLTDVSDWPTKG